MQNERPTVFIGIRLGPALAEQTKRRARAQGTTVSSVIRDAVMVALKDDAKA